MDECKPLIVECRRILKWTYGYGLTLIHLSAQREPFWQSPKLPPIMTLK